MEEDMKYNDEDQLYAYAIYGLNLENDSSEEHRKFINAVHNIATDFRNNRTPFDKSRPCLICGKTGHSFDECEDLRDHERVRMALIRLTSAAHRFVSNYNKIKNPKPISLLASMTMRELQNYAQVNSTSTSVPSSTEDSRLFAAVHALTKNVSRIDGAVRQLASVLLNTQHDNVDDDDDDSINSDSSLNAIASFLRGSGKRSDFCNGRDKI